MVMDGVMNKNIVFMVDIKNKEKADRSEPYNIQ